MSLESRLGAVPHQRTRTVTEHAPQLVRRFLREHLVDERGVVGALRIVADEVDEDVSQYWSDGWAGSRLDELFADLDWFTVYRLIEEQQPEHDLAGYQAKVNAVLARASVAYEMSGGQLQRLDETGAAFGAAGDERRALDVMDGRFRPARDQYRLAVQALDAIPTRPKDAVREAVNALEAVLKIITGRGDASLGDVAADLVRDSEAPWRGSLGASLRSLYGYASQVPGARHAQHIDAEVTTAEAALVVRMCGAAIVYFIDQHGT